MKSSALCRCILAAPVLLVQPQPPSPSHIITVVIATIAMDTPALSAWFKGRVVLNGHPSQGPELRKPQKPVGRVIAALLWARGLGVDRLSCL